MLLLNVGNQVFGEAASSLVVSVGPKSISRRIIRKGQRHAGTAYRDQAARNLEPKNLIENPNELCKLSLQRCGTADHQLVISLPKHLPKFGYN